MPFLFLSPLNSQEPSSDMHTSLTQCFSLLDSLQLSNNLCELQNNIVNNWIISQELILFYPPNHQGQCESPGYFLVLQAHFPFLFLTLWHHIYTIRGTTTYSSPELPFYYCHCMCRHWIWMFYQTIGLRKCRDVRVKGEIENISIYIYKKKQYRLSQPCLKHFALKYGKKSVLIFSQ